MNRHALTAAFAGALLLSATGAAAGAAIPLEPSTTPNSEAPASSKPAAQDVVSTGSAAGQAFCVISGSAISLLGSTHLSCTP
ncbi:hypothetical protein [Nocardia aurantia]|uniref:hypothetical protein n=1 Tax=Nocardia aurantia TaxID=2585199 RepID=UPI0012957F7F|nr:hypothetical protein [Nocardia aurantia]